MNKWSTYHRKSSNISLQMLSPSLFHALTLTARPLNLVPAPLATSHMLSVTFGLYMPSVGGVGGLGYCKCKRVDGGGRGWINIDVGVTDTTASFKNSYQTMPLEWNVEAELSNIDVGEWGDG